MVFLTTLSVGQERGVMEGINNKAKLILRQSYGLKDFQMLRARLLASFSD